MQVRFVASKSDQKRAGCTITRTRVADGAEAGGSSAGAFEALLDLLRINPQLPGEAPFNHEAHPAGMESGQTNASGRGLEAEGWK